MLRDEVSVYQTPLFIKQKLNLLTKSFVFETYLHTLSSDLFGRNNRLINEPSGYCLQHKCMSDSKTFKNTKNAFGKHLRRVFLATN